MSNEKSSVEAAANYFPSEVVEEFSRMGDLLQEMNERHGIDFMLVIAVNGQIAPTDPNPPEMQVNLMSASVLGTTRLGLCSHWLSAEICPHEMATLVIELYGDQCSNDETTDHAEVC